MAINILTDSAVDILPDEAKELGINIIPLTLTWDGKDYRDAIDMNHKEFFEKLTSSDSIPTTSQIPPVIFESEFEKLTQNGDSLVVITLSSVLSGTCQSACIAAQSFEDRVFVVDSLSATVGQRLLVLKAIEYRDRGLKAAKIAELLNEDKKRIRVLAKLDTLEYLKKGGRISSAVALAGGLLSIKPVISVVDGGIILVGKARGSKNGNNLLRKFIAEAGGINFAEPFRLVYSGLTDELLQEYIDDSTDLWADDVESLPKSSIGAVIGTHIGPGAIGIAFFVK